MRHAEQQAPRRTAAVKAEASPLPRGHRTGRRSPSIPLPPRLEHRPLSRDAPTTPPHVLLEARWSVQGAAPATVAAAHAARADRVCPPQASGARGAPPPYTWTRKCLHAPRAAARAEHARPHRLHSPPPRRSRPRHWQPGSSRALPCSPACPPPPRGIESPHRLS